MDLIDRQAAIKAFKDFLTIHDSRGIEYLCSAVTMDGVNKILSDLPSAQPEPQNVTDTNVGNNDLISRQAAIDALENDWNGMVVDVFNLIRDLPSVEPDSKDLIEKIKNGITASDGNSEYFIGLRNGMRWCLSLIDDKEPLYENCPSAQPNLQPTCNQFATDCISRQAAINAVGSMLRRKFGIGGDLAEITLEDLPSADAVEVVRCKDCKWYKKNYSSWNGKEFKICAREPTEPSRRPDDFCSYGERKDG